MFKKGNTFGSVNKNRIVSDKTREKMRLAKLNKPSNAKGKKRKPEGVERMAASKRGKTHSVEYRLKNREGQIKRYLKINPNYEIAPRNKRIVNNGGFHSNGEWDILKAQYNWTCPRCKRPEPEIKLTKDHIIPLLKGGSNNIENIQPLCGQCNSEKHTQTIKY